MKLILVVVVTVLYRSSEVNSDKTLCRKENTSCYYQLWNTEVSEKACQIEYELQKCAAYVLADNGRSKRSLGNVKLFAHVDKENNRILFDVIFSNISWKTNLMRFVGVNEPIRNICKMFNIWDNVTVPDEATLKYSCPWTRPEDADKIFIFDYETRAGNEVDARKFIFKMPITHNLHNRLLHFRELFAYVEFTNTEVLKLRIQPLEENYRITEYNVEIWKKKDEEPPVKVDRRVLSSQNITDGLLHLDYSTGNDKGHYYFEIYFNGCPDGTCLKTVTPEILVGGETNNGLIIGVASATIIFFLLMGAWCLWNKLKLIKELPDNQKKAFIIYIPSSKEHQLVVSCLAQVLSKLFGIKIFLDVLHIPLTDHKNPLIWCSEALQEVTHIIYIASPKHHSNYPSVYKTEPIALRILEEEISRKDSEKKICCVTFPHAENIPTVLKNFRSFKLMKKFGKFINYIHNFSEIFNINLPKNCEEQLVYKQLVDSVKKAQENYSESSMIAVPVLNVKFVVNNEDKEHTNEDAAEKENLIEKDDTNVVFNIHDLNLSGVEDEENNRKSINNDSSIDLQNFDNL